MFPNKTVEVWKPYYMVNGVLTTGEFLVGTSLNLICLSFFLRKRGSAINLLFIFVSATDLSLSFIMIFSAVSAFTEGRPLAFGNKLFCNMWGLVWHTGCGFSIYLMAVLALTRWFGLARPFTRFKKRYVAASILTYLFIQVFKSTMNYWYMRESYVYNAEFLGCSVSNINVEHITTLDKVLYTLLYVFEVLLPGIPAFVFSIATFLDLLGKDKLLQKSSCRRSERSSESDGNTPVAGDWRKKRHATVTILILLSTYLLLNVWFWLLTLGDAFFIFSDKSLDYTTMWNGDVNSYYMTYYAIYIHTVVLNSSANAIIYVLRLKGIRAYIVYLFRSTKNTEVCPSNVIMRKRTAASVLSLCKIPSLGNSNISQSLR